MLFRLLVLVAISVSVVSASAEERVTIGAMREIANGALFDALGRDYFKAEGLRVDFTAYASEADVAKAVATGKTDFGLVSFTPAVFNYAGRGLIKAIAGRVGEKRDYEGNVLVVSTNAFALGMRTFDSLANRSIAIDRLGSSFHYQVAQIARVKRFDFKTVMLKPMVSYDAMARAVGTAQADAALLPLQYARELLVSNQARFVGWFSEIDNQQLGALFVSTKVIESNRGMIEKFLRAYRLGAADYSLMLQLDHGKRLSTPESRVVATAIAPYVYPDMHLSVGAATVEAGAYYMDPQGRLDLADLARQVEWYKAEGLIDKTIDAAQIADTSFNAQ